MRIIYIKSSVKEHTIENCDDNSHKGWRGCLIYIELQPCLLQGDANRTNPVHNTAAHTIQRDEEISLLNTRLEKTSCDVE